MGRNKDLIIILDMFMTIMNECVPTKPNRTSAGKLYCTKLFFMTQDNTHSMTDCEIDGNDSSIVID